MKLRENMLIAIHVGAHGPQGGASSTDNYLITADGAVLTDRHTAKNHRSLNHVDSAEG